MGGGPSEGDGDFQACALTQIITKHPSTLSGRSSCERPKGTPVVRTPLSNNVVSWPGGISFPGSPTPTPAKSSFPATARTPWSAGFHGAHTL